MSFVVKSGVVDISQYIIDSSLAYVVERNRNFTPVLSEITMVVSSAILTSFIAPDSVIRIAYASNPNYPFYIGLISESKFNYERRTYSLQIRSILTKLQDFIVEYQILHAAIAAGATPQQYLASDNSGHPSVQILWLINKMFEQCNIEVSTPNGSIPVETITFDFTQRQIQLQHLRLDENMLYALNQDFAANHTTIDTDIDMVNKKITFWDFITYFCSMFGSITLGRIGFVLRWSQTGVKEELGMFLRDPDPITTITDDTTYERETGNIIGAEGGYSLSIRFASRDAYTASAKTTLTDHETIYLNGKNQVFAINNLAVLYERFWTSPGYSLGFDNFPLYNYKPVSMYSNYINEKIADYELNKWTTTDLIFTRAKSNGINISAQTAEVEEEL